MSDTDKLMAELARRDEQLAKWDMLYKAKERELAAAQGAVRELCGVLEELSDAMRRYEADVDTEAPSSHHRMMDRVRAALAKHAPKS